jgi:hypothetical protein
MKAGNLILSIMVTLLIGGVAHAGNRVPDLRLLEVQDGYEISYGPMIEAYQGQENVLIPLYISNEEAIEYIHLNLSYDASVIEPTLMAPSLFYQYFHYDLSIQGLISIDIECDLPTPPVVPPIPPGDTIFAYILCDVVVDDLDQDVFGELGYFEDPNTPFPDNFLMRDNGYFIVAPQLLLTGGMIDVFSPVYGDINLNSLPYEIGDVITFISFLSGQIEFSPRQMANSDCNQDGIPATIADLVYMLNVINGESEQLATGQPVIPDILELGTVLQNLLPKPIKSLDKSNILHLNIIANKPLGGFVNPVKVYLSRRDSMRQYGL